MDYATVKAVIEKYLDPHDSLVLTRHRGSKDLYYFTVPYKEIEEFLERINITGSIVSRCEFDCNWGESKTDYMCIKMVDYDPDHIDLYFYDYSKIRVTFNKRSKRAELKTGKLLFKMSVNTASNHFYWFDGAHNYYPLRFYFDLNRLLLAYKTFRNIFADLLALLPDSCLLRDLISDIRKYGYILPRIAVADAGVIHSKKELMRKYYPCDLQLNFNTLTINEGYAASVLASMVNQEDHYILSDYIKNSSSAFKLLDPFPDLDTLSHMPLIGDFMFSYYRYLFEKADFERDCYLDSHLVSDYLHMVMDTGDRVKLSFKSSSQFVRFHDNVVASYMKKAKTEQLDQDIVPKNSRFEPLKYLLPAEFEHIDTTDRLYQEGENQHNCVFSYRSRILNDDCAIYHWENDGREYTIEFTMTGFGAFKIKQMMQKYNFPYLNADYRKVHEYLNEYNETIINRRIH